MMVMAGLWDIWQRPGHETITSFTVVTTAANSFMAGVHNRMPVIAAADDWPFWLGETAGTSTELKALLQPCPDEDLQMWAVGPAVGNVKNDNQGLSDPIELVV
jgi:putative SOS response-associated peptidase YedK